MAVDHDQNEQTSIVSFNVDHTFVQKPPVIYKENQQVSENSLLIIIGAVIAAAIVIPIIFKKIRKTSTENKILKEDL